jgi:hypothetical protein
VHGAHPDDAERERRPERVRELHGALPLRARDGAPAGDVPVVAPHRRGDVGDGEVILDAPRFHRAPVVLGRSRRQLRRRWCGDQAQREPVGIRFGLHRVALPC